MKTSRIKLLMTFAPTGTYVRDHRTTPEVVRISKVSNMVVAGGVRVCRWEHVVVRAITLGMTPLVRALYCQMVGFGDANNGRLKAEIQQ
jgi:hypothetical protein